MEVWRGIAEGLNAAIVNPSIIMGEGDWNKGTARFFTRSYGNPKFYTEGVSGFVDVKDVARAMILLMESDISADRFILNAENLPYKTVFEWIAEALGKKPAPYKANAFLSAMAWRFEAFRSKLTNSRPLITKETAQSANSEYLFDNSKFLNAFSNFEFTSIKDTILRVSKKFLDEH